MKLFFAFVLKETKHIFRDTRTMLILFAMPVALMLIFGFAVRTDVRCVRTAVVDATPSALTQQLVGALRASGYFDIDHIVAFPSEAEQLIRCQKADIAIVFSPDLSSRCPALQVITDGTDPNMAQQYSSYAMQTLAPHLTSITAQSGIVTHLLYNPQMQSSYNFVPGIMGMLLLLICAMMTSISIVREKERGTMEVLLVSPVRPLAVIVAKAVPYMLLAFCVLTAILLLSRFVLHVPLAGSLAAIIGMSSLYIVLALSLGLLISTTARTQLVALLLSAVVLLLPSVMLSGMMFPVESMPKVLQYVSAVMPPRYYISAMRKLMIMGVDASDVVFEATVLGAMTAFFLSVALVKFKNRLE